MIIRRDALKAALVCCTSHDTRYYLHAVQIQPAGYVEATDGGILVRVSDRAPQPDEEYPQVPGVANLVGTLTAPLLISHDVAMKLIGATAKKSTIPILTSIRVGTDGDSRYAIATDLEVPLVVCLDSANQDQKFPTTDRVLIKKGDRKVVKLILAAEMLQKLAKVATEIGRTRSTNSVTLEIPIEPAYQGTITEEGETRGDGIINSGVRFTASGLDCTVEGVVMPCRP